MPAEAGIDKETLFKKIMPSSNINQDKKDSANISPLAQNPLIGQEVPAQEPLTQAPAQESAEQEQPAAEIEMAQDTAAPANQIEEKQNNPQIQASSVSTEIEQEPASSSNAPEQINGQSSQPAQAASQAAPEPPPENTISIDSSAAENDDAASAFAEQATAASSQAEAVIPKDSSAPLLESYATLQQQIINGHEAQESSQTLQNDANTINPQEDIAVENTQPLQPQEAATAEPAQEAQPKTEPALPLQEEPAAQTQAAPPQAEPAVQQPAPQPAAAAPQQAAAAPAEDIYPINVVELIVEKYVDGYVHRFNACSCKICREDICSLTLSKITPHYVASNVISESDLLDKKLVSQTVNTLVKSVLLVKKSPSHR